MASFVEQNGHICSQLNRIIRGSPSGWAIFVNFQKKIHLNHISRVFRAIWKKKIVPIPKPFNITNLPDSFKFPFTYGQVQDTFKRLNF